MHKKSGYKNVGVFLCQRALATKQIMNITQKEIKARLAAAPDFWLEARKGITLSDSLDGILPDSRALPDCALARPLVAEGCKAYSILLNIIRHETSAGRLFKNAVFALMYFDNLFVYKGLKETYPAAPVKQQKWLDAACRKIILRCLEVPQNTQPELTREIVRNTYKNRLATTSMVVDIAGRLWEQRRRRIVIRDMAVSDGITTLDLALAIEGKRIPASIIGTDLRLLLIYAEQKGNRAVSFSNGPFLQAEINGTLYGIRQRSLTEAPYTQKQRLVAALTGGRAATITLLAPQVEIAAMSKPDILQFREEDVFNPHPSIAEADIIRVANLFVERSEDHRGYYYRKDIISAIAKIGRKAKDGAHLFLDNFRKKIEHVGHWRKDESAQKWVRISVEGNVIPDLDGIGNIPIE